MMQEIDMDFDLPWQMICAVACRSYVMGISFEELIVLAMRDYIRAKA